MENEIIKTKSEIIVALNAANIKKPKNITNTSLENLFKEKKENGTYVIMLSQIRKFTEQLNVELKYDEFKGGGIWAGAVASILFQNANQAARIRNECLSFIKNRLKIVDNIEEDMAEDIEDAADICYDDNVTIETTEEIYDMKEKTKSQIIDALRYAYITPPDSIDKESIESLISNHYISHKQIGLLFYRLGLISSSSIADNSTRESWVKKFENEIVIIDDNNEEDIIHVESNKSNIDITFDRIQEIYQQLILEGTIEMLDPDETPYDLSEPNTVYHTSQNKGVDVTKADNIWLRFSEEISTDIYMLVASDNELHGTVIMFGSFLSENGMYYLEAKAQNIRLDFSSNNLAYYLIFDNKNHTKHYAVEISIQTEELATDDYYLCIDFGTSNTTAGTWLKETQEAELVTFEDVSDASKPSSFLLPTIAYVESAESEREVHFLFGYEAKKRLMETDYQPKGSIFYNIKQWVSLDSDYTIDCHDEKNHSIRLHVHDIISEYLRYVVSQAEIKLKKRFVKFHFSSPVKLKARLFEIVSKTFKADDGFTIVPPNESLDEAIAIIYERLSELREEYLNNTLKSTGEVMIIDCGGGTTDVARCKYSFSQADTGVKSLIRVQSVNGQNFGGNELTYRIFQLLKIKLSDYYKSEGQQGTIQVTSIDDLVSTSANEYLSTVDRYIQQVIAGEKPVFTYYDKLDDASRAAEWVLPTDFANHEIVQGKNLKAQAQRNFNYLWSWAERIKIEFYTGESRAYFKFAEEKLICTDKALYFYADPTGEETPSKLPLKKQTSVPDIAINIKELTALLSPQIYFILSIMLLKSNGTELFFDSTDIQNARMRLSGQSCKIELFRDLLKEYIPGRITRDSSGEQTSSIKMKLACVKGCIQYLLERQLGFVSTQIQIDPPNINYRVTVKQDSINSETELLNGRMIHQKNDVKIMDRIRLVTRPFKEGDIYYNVYNNIVSSNTPEKKDVIKIKTDLSSNHYTHYTNIDDLLERVKQSALSGIDEYCYDHEGKQESVINRLKEDIESVKTESVPKLIYFIVPNNDGCGFVLWQIVKKEDCGKRIFFLSNPSHIDYLPDKAISRFDGRNCK
ncbi:hypothetical protein [Ruminococcus flavefaciens]|uniref:hypothetical protein n=1 Tax=Ruminococcus flavefaciens TaxID=1265 RepID=UPI00048E2E9F|nr:hypothetical protein [Ruminococcus flavefaciens]